MLNVRFQHVLTVRNLSLPQHEQQQGVTHDQIGHREINVYKQTKKQGPRFQISNRKDENNCLSHGLFHLLWPRFIFPFTPFPLLRVLV